MRLLWEVPLKTSFLENYQKNVCSRLFFKNLQDHSPLQPTTRLKTSQNMFFLKHSERKGCSKISKVLKKPL